MRYSTVSQEAIPNKIIQLLEPFDPIDGAIIANQVISPHIPFRTRELLYHGSPNGDQIDRADELLVVLFAC